MIDRPPGRRITIVILLAAVPVSASACGASSDATSRPTITLTAEATTYETLPVATAPTEPTEAVDSTPNGAVQEYEIQAGDFPLAVADQFGVTLADLESANGWSDAGQEFPNPGNVIKIPPGAVNSDPPTDADDGEQSAGVTIPTLGDGCDPGSHTVVAGDIPLKLVDLYDITLEALEQANRDNPAYQRFILGDQIVIPAKADC